MSISKNKLNVLYHHRTQGRGAECVHILSIVNALEKMGHVVTILSPPGVDPRNNLNLAPVDKSKTKVTGINRIWSFVSKHIPNIIFEVVEIFYNIPSSLRLNKELKNKRYDLVYERYAFYMISGAHYSKKFNIPFVLEVNEVSGLDDRARKQYFKYFGSIFERYIFKRCSGIMTVSSYLKNKAIENKADAKIISVVSNAIEVETIQSVTKDIKLVNKFNFGESTVLGFAGWFDHWDRLDFFVDAFNALKKEGENIKILLIGDGKVVDEIKNKINDLDLNDDIIFTGAVQKKEMHKYISLIDIAVLPHSNNFGSPVILFEMMSLKIPIIGPNLLPITDVVENNITGLIFKPLDLSSLCDSIRRYLSSKELRENHADNAYEKLINNYTWKNNALKIIEVIK